VLAIVPSSVSNSLSYDARDDTRSVAAETSCSSAAVATPDAVTLSPLIAVARRCPATVAISVIVKLRRSPTATGTDVSATNSAGPVWAACTKKPAGSVPSTGLR
jgi:hypothetical protein